MKLERNNMLLRARTAYTRVLSSIALSCPYLERYTSFIRYIPDHLLLRFPLFKQLEQKASYDMGEYQICLVDRNSGQLDRLCQVYEINTPELTKKVVTHGMNAIDLGAHKGYYTMLLAQIVGEDGNVWAFEIEEKWQKLLAEAIQRNNFNHVHLVEKGILDSTDENMVTLDDFFVEQGIQIDFVMSDIDGHEIEMIKGGERFFSNRDLSGIIEVHAHFTRKHGGSSFDVFDFLERKGFTLYSIKEPFRNWRPNGHMFFSAKELPSDTLELLDPFDSCRSKIENLVSKYEKWVKYL